jgi:hypothetical protein
MKLSEFIGLLEKYPKEDPCRFYDIKNNDFLYYAGYAVDDRVIIYLRPSFRHVSYGWVSYFLNTITNKEQEVKFCHLRRSANIPGGSIISYNYELANPQTGIP